MSIAALAGAASSIMPGLGGQAVKPAYGLGFRFTVKIEANPMADLGAWQSCSGLKVEFKSTEVKQGGNYLTQRRLPDKAFYPKVVLKRAVLASSSSKVQEWLTKAARDWLTDDPASVGSDATITLYDSNDKPVLEWVLKRARPAAWSGPDLDATSSKVAIETLELEHEGFEVKPAGSKPGTPAAGKDKKQQLPVLSEGKAKVEFSFPPERVTLDIRAKELRGNQAGTADQATAGFLSGVTSYKLADLIVQGTNTKQLVKQLATWATAVPKKTDGKPSPCPPDPAKSGSAANKAKPGGDKEQPHISFKWGTSFDFVVQIKQLTAVYTRFSPDGQPIRATVGLTLQVVREITIGGHRANGAANPTSGGIAGRASHVLTESDTLPLLAREHYGTPGSWRDIAEANGIDDPLRVAPGRVLYLPAASELTNGSPR